MDGTQDYTVVLPTSEFIAAHTPHNSSDFNAHFPPKVVEEIWQEFRAVLDEHADSDAYVIEQALSAKWVRTGPFYRRSRIINTIYSRRNWTSDTTSVPVSSCIFSSLSREAET